WSVEEETLILLVLGQQLQYALAQGVVAGTGSIEVSGAFGRIRFLQSFDEDVAFTHGSPLPISATNSPDRAKKTHIFAKGRKSLRAFNFASQPGPREGPEKVGLARGDTEHLRRLRDRQAGEVAELDEVGRERVLPGQPVQGFVEGKEVLVDFGRHDRGGIEYSPFPAPAVLGARAPPRLLDEDAPHGFRCGGEEVSAAIPVAGVVHVHQP